MFDNLLYVDKERLQYENQFQHFLEDKKNKEVNEKVNEKFQKPEFERYQLPESHEIHLKNKK